MIRESVLRSINYDDILLLPKYSAIDSRDNVCLLSTGKQTIPIFSAPMKNISEANLVIELGKLGGIGILHRFFEKTEDRYVAVDTIASHNIPFGISVGLHDWELELEYIKYSTDKGCSYVVIDTASGYMRKTSYAVYDLYHWRKNNKINFDIIAGNVISYDGCKILAQKGADIIRVNIGSGIQCLTSRSIGIGCPALTAINDCSRIKLEYKNIKLLSDGGIYNPGQGLKALCFGADGLMIGSLFGRAKETENNGVIFGMSSFALQERMNKTKKSNEGTVTVIPKEEIRPLRDIFTEFTYGIRSGLAYLGCDNINDLHNIDVEYIRVK